MHIHAAAMVFESWAPHPEYPEQVGRIVCCGRSVVQRAGVIQCDSCGTAIEKRGESWEILKVRPLVDRPADLYAELWQTPGLRGLYVIGKIVLLMASLPADERLITWRRVSTLMEVYGYKSTRTAAG